MGSVLTAALPCPCLRSDYDMKGPEAIPLGFKLVSDLLSDAGYETHAVGKWNLGSKVKPYTPTRRGFSTFFGYYAACQVDYWCYSAQQIDHSDYSNYS
jgi:arylsulfatase A-like enzyme